MLAAVGAVLLVGVLLDLTVLWVFQKQSTIQWEYAALGSTTNSYPLLALSAALFHGALALGGSESLVKYRLAAAYVVALGLFGLIVGFLIGSNYLAVSKGKLISAEMAPVFKSVLLKSGGVSLWFGLVLSVAGILALRRPRSR